MQNFDNIIDSIAQKLIELDSSNTPYFPTLDLQNTYTQLNLHTETSLALQFWYY